MTVAARRRAARRTPVVQGAATGTEDRRGRSRGGNSEDNTNRMAQAR
jgi:hypothetical protein